MKYLDPREFRRGDRWRTITDPRDLPCEPGVYAFTNKAGVFYIGSTVNLRQRVRGHISSDREGRFVGCSIRFKVCDYPLFIEERLVKRLKPAGNKYWVTVSGGRPIRGTHS